MTRHGKNQTASAVYSYSERKKDEKQSGWGTLNQRLGADSIKEFDCCSLTLQPCRDPVVTPDGWLYDKQAVLEYILQQKRENARRMKQWQKQRDKDKEEILELARAEKQKEIEKFAAKESTPAHPGAADLDEAESLLAAATSGSVSNMAGKKSRHLPSFWVPQMLPTAKASRIMEKPDQKVYCPNSKKQLKVKDLIPVKFTPINDDDPKTSTAGKTLRYMCAVTHDALTNKTPCAVLKTSGHVVTMTCVQQIVRKEMIDPTNSQPLTEADIIELQRGGTGFSATNEGLDAKLARPVLELQ